jgi:hypothetical protein
MVILLIYGSLESPISQRHLKVIPKIISLALKEQNALFTEIMTKCCGNLAILNMVCSLVDKLVLS